MKKGMHYGKAKGGKSMSYGKKSGGKSASGYSGAKYAKDANVVESKAKTFYA